MKGVTVVAFGLSLALVGGCGAFKKKKDSPDSPESPESRLVVATYDDEPAPSNAFAKDAAAGAPQVANIQKLGSALARSAVKAGKITLDDGQIVQLMEIARADCPQTIVGCTTSDSAKLKIGAEALVEDLTKQKQTIRSQGERPTCVSFALSGAMEVMLRRKGLDHDLAEQYTYFLGKQATDSWDKGGLAPAATMARFADGALPFADEANWPYNSAQASCGEYNTAHPGFACSATEAQGGGQAGRDPEPKAAPVAHVVLAHELMASVGRVKQALYRGYPVVLSVNSNIDFNVATKKKGVVSWIFKESKCEDPPCGHAVLAVGYKDDAEVEGGGYVVVKNSWGAKWGEGGLGYLTYTWLENSILDAQALVSVQN